MRRLCRAGVCALLASVGAGAGADEPATRQLTIEEAFARAVSENASVASAEIDRERADEQVRYFRSFVFPRLTLSGAYTYNSKEAAFGSGADRRVIQPQEDWTARLGFRQPIYAGAREWRAYAQAKVGVDKADSTIAEVANQVLLGVGLDFLSAVEAQALVEVEQQNVALSERRREQSQAFFEVGEVTQVDVLRAEAAIQAARRQLVAAEGELGKAQGRLRLSLLLDGDLEVVPPGSFLPPMPDEAALQAQAADNNPGLRQAGLDLQVAELEVKKQKGGALPVIYADGGWQQQKRDFPTASNFAISLNVQVPVFLAGEVSSQVAEAQQKLQLARIRLDDARRRLREDLHAALLDVDTARRVRALARDELRTAEAEHTQAFELYRAQESTALDLGAAELALADARRNAVTADINVQRSELRAWYFAGALRAAFVPQGGSSR